MAGNKGKGKHDQREGKRKRPPSSPLDDFGDLEFLEEHFSFEGDNPPLPAPLSSSFDYSGDSMGLSVAERAYIRSVERAELEGSDDSEEEDSEGEDSEGEDSKEEDGGGDGNDYEGGDKGGGSDNEGSAGVSGAGGGDDNGYDDGDESGEGSSDNDGKGNDDSVDGRAPPA
jgi:hypothetical protein